MKKTPLIYKGIITYISPVDSELNKRYIKLIQEGNNEKSFLFQGDYMLKLASQFSCNDFVEIKAVSSVSNHITNITAKGIRKQKTGVI